MYELIRKLDPWMFALCLGLLLLAWGLMALLISGKREEEQREAVRRAGTLTSELIEEDKRL